MTAAPVWSVDPRTGKRRERVTDEATPAAVDTAVRAAHEALPALADRTRRAAFLREAAARLDARGEDVIRVSDEESALGVPRLTGELARTTAQLRAFADEVEDGGYLGVIIDHADPTLTPPRPDLRRYKVPLGVVAVYAASNFPLAFSVPGGDTASALAAGCPVVVKAHPDHPATSELCAAELRAAAAATGLPEDTVRVVHGFEAGVELVKHPLVAAAGFTGSVRGGRALHDAAAARPRPIPFHGELGSLNPVVVTPAAAAERAEEIGTGLGGSMTLGTGQFCVKPGLVLVPDGADGDRMLGVLADGLRATAPGYLLDDRMRDAYLSGAAARGALARVEVPVAAGPGDDDPRTVRPGLLTVSARELDGTHELLLEECFGPVTVAVRYGDEEDVDAVLGRLTGSLTATLHVAASEAESGADSEAGTGTGDGGDGTRAGAGPRGAAAALLSRLTLLAGRVLVNGWPTGVAVAPAQHHGGPYPATTSTSTSVGATALERWLRPVAYQDTPEPLLPPELRDANPLGLPRRVD